jgi:fatty acid elongase 3
MWQSFEVVSQTVFRRSPTSFKFVVGETPLSTFNSVALAIGLYYLVIFGGRQLMRTRKAFDLSTVNKYHNLNLTLVSGTLLVLMVEQLVPALWSRGLSYNACGNGGFTPSLTTLYYLNYLTKYLEFADTLLLVLRKKPLTFLHTYHHGATAFLCYTQLIGHTPVAWVPIVLNLSVHVLMYWYYFRASCGIKSWYKEYITLLQIVQFIIDLSTSHTPI